jgi:predicted Na+-dependent transporter
MLTIVSLLNAQTLQRCSFKSNIVLNFTAQDVLTKSSIVDIAMVMIFFGHRASLGRRTSFRRLEGNNKMLDNLYALSLVIVPLAGFY